jgi:isopenicillin-N N-acyltransferase-like protein
VRKGLLEEINRRNHYTFEEVVKQAMRYMEYGRAYAPHLDEEMRGIADGAGVKYEEICLLQVRSELAYPATARATDECTGVAIQSSRSASGKTLIGQNLDMGQGLHRLGIVLHLEPSEGPRILTWALAGTVGQTGLNSAGLARCGNVLFCRGWRTGVPTTFLFRRILEQRNVPDAVEICRSTRRAKSNNVLLADRDDNIANVEMTVEDDRLLEVEDGLLYHTNHYRHSDLAAFDAYSQPEDSRARLRRLQELLPGRRLWDEAGIESLLSDHANRPTTICKHAEDSPTKLMTVASVVMTPEIGRMHICLGTPCSGHFVDLCV